MHFCSHEFFFAVALLFFAVFGAFFCVEQSRFHLPGFFEPCPCLKFSALPEMMISTMGAPIYPNPKEHVSSCLLAVKLMFTFLFRRGLASVFHLISAENGLSRSRSQRTSIESLPDECLFEILRRLPAGQDRSVCASVSKRWLMLLSSICKTEIHSYGSTGNENQEISDEGYLSRSLEGKKATDVRLAAIAVGTASRGGLGKLTIRGCNSDRGVTNVGLKAIAHGCPSLKVCSLWDVATVGDVGLIEIASGCHQLEKLDLCKCPNISDKTLIAVAKNCPNLAELSIESCPNIGNEGLQAIGKCPNLRSISIKNCSGVGDQGVAGLLSSASFALTKVKLESLTVSDLSLAVIGHYGVAVTDLVLICLPNVSEKGFWVMGNAHGLQKLTSITINCCQGVTDVGLEPIGRGCPNVQNLKLRKSAFLSDKGLVSFARAAPSVESLQLAKSAHRITQIGLFGVFFNCGAKLKVLTLISCYGIKDLNMDLPAISPSESIWSLTIHDCPGFGNANLALLGKLCPRLQHVELSGLQGVTDAGFLPLLESSEAGLVKVNLNGCVNLSDRVVLSMVNSHGWTLEVLSLDGCKRVGDASLMAIAGSCPLLADLDVSRCAITDTGIAALARGKQINLEVLSLAGCAIGFRQERACLEKNGLFPCWIKYQALQRNQQPLCQQASGTSLACVTSSTEQEMPQQLL
uniref:Grr1 n=1 Tax=Glycine max TaxID=3847 RepID=O22512_SOYBN|nr:grr1 [Glycine max]